MKWWNSLTTNSFSPGPLVIEELTALWNLAMTLRPSAPEQAFEALDFFLMNPTLEQWPASCLKRTFPPELFLVAHDRQYHWGWGYILDDPRAKTPKQCVHYSFQTGVSCVLSTYHILNVLVDRVNDFIEDREESLYASKDIDLFYRLGEQLLTVYREFPVTYKGMVFRSSSIVAPTLDGLGIVVPPETFTPPPQTLKLSHFKEFQEKISESLTQQKPGLGLLWGRDLWFQSPPELLGESGELLGQIYQALDRDSLRLRLNQIQRYCSK